MCRGGRTEGGPPGVVVVEKLVGQAVDVAHVLPFLSLAVVVAIITPLAARIGGFIVVSLNLFQWHVGIFEVLQELERTGGDEIIAVAGAARRDLVRNVDGNEFSFF